jgi:N-acyl-D-aspartate/D-glutamate deacylase
MAYDLIIKNARIVDGTGKKAFAGGVAVKDGRIAEIGDVDGEAKRVIDAGGQVLAPGFIDAHSHYDAQLLWDPIIDPATAHGVTTVLIGNCGFTLAPVKPKDQDYLLGLFSATEEVPKSALLKHAPLKWETFAEYLSFVEKIPLGVNVLTQVGHSAMRCYVMGEDALKREATNEEIAEMTQIAEAAMDAGAAGVSTSYSPHHVDEFGAHIPSYFAADAETEALAAAVGRKKKPLFSINPYSKREGLSEKDRALLSRIAEISGAVVTWNDLGPGAPNWLSVVEFMEKEIESGRKIYVVARCQPAETRFMLNKISPLYSGSQPWLEYCKLDFDGMMAALADPEWRARLSEYWNNFPYLSLASVEKAASSANAPFEGRYLTDIAKERSQSPVDAMFDIALEDKLETIFLLQEAAKEDESEAQRFLRSPAVLVGISDGGAHLQTFSGADFPTYFLKHWVRETGTFTLEQGVAALTSEPAAFIGLTDRGMIEVGKAADLVIFDPDKVEPASLETREFPGGGVRLAKRARAIPYVIVNGVPIIENGEPSGAVPGELLRA